jgi:hypothetical protein
MEFPVVGIKGADYMDFWGRGGDAPPAILMSATLSCVVFVKKLF